MDMKSFIVRPVYRLLRYELLLRGLLEETSAGHGDLESIPALLDVIKGLGKEIEPRVMSAKQKQKVWEYTAKLDFKAGEHIVCLFCLVRARVPRQRSIGHGLASRESAVDPYLHAHAAA
jgi:hypothetical protein